MSQLELLSRTIQLLNTAGISYLVTGSFASSLQGEPRATHDVDFVVDMHPSHLEVLLQAFPSPDYYLSHEAALAAIRARKMFNVLDTRAGIKVDFWMLKPDPFDRSRFARRQRGTIRGLEVFVSSPEDTILAKLRWTAMSGGSETHFRDALRVYEVQGNSLDRGYLDLWAKELHVEDLWQRIQREAAPLDPDEL